MRIIDVFTSSFGDFRSKRPEIVVALADMRKRGEAVSPLLLKLMDENQETGFETSVLSSIAALGTVQLEPYLEYSRKVLRERTRSMSAVLAGSASNLLAEHGTKEDAQLMKWVMEQRPWLADSVTRKLDELNSRLSLPKQEPHPSLKGLPTTGSRRDIGSRDTEQNAPAVISEKDQKTTRWVAWALAMLVAGGLLKLVLKKRK